tara:strand:+ start:699 stop:1163 length:465 start_codon:yes stop_codon:yes gene_type:complete
MKKHLLILLLTVLTISCSKEDEPIAGCMDPLSVTYNSNAVESDGSCKYTLTGNWYLSRYDFNAVNYLPLFTNNDLWLDVLSNNSYDLWGEEIATGEFISSKGTLATSGPNLATLTLTSLDGTVSIYTITQINGSSVSFNGINYGDTEYITAIKL